MLVTLEGIDGSGKTTAWESLQESFPDAVFTSEPTDSWYGDAVRRSIDEPAADPLAELFLYTADHAAHLADTIEPALDRGALVIADRYADSRYAYQGAAIEAAAEGPATSIQDPMEYVRSIHAPFTRDPDLTLYFDVEPETGAERSGGANKFERVSFLQAVREGYEELAAAAPDRYVRIDAERSTAAVLETARTTIEQALDGH